MICPLLAIARRSQPENRDYTDECHEEDCAWWDPPRGECSTLTIAKGFWRLELAIHAFTLPIVRGEEPE